MKGLILYRSHFGNTKLVAESIAYNFREQGHEAVLHDLRQGLPDLSTADLLVVGSPTRFARPDGKTLNVLKEMRKRGLTSVPLAIFDTYGPDPGHTLESGRNRWFSPGAAGILLREAQKLGLNVCRQTLRCAVAVGQKGPLAENQLEQAPAFVNNFLAGCLAKCSAESSAEGSASTGSSIYYG